VITISLGNTLCIFIAYYKNDRKGQETSS